MMMMKKNSSTDLGCPSEFFSVEPLHVLASRRVPFPLFKNEGLEWVRTDEAGTLLGDDLAQTNRYARKKERMAWVSFLLSILDKEHELSPQDTAHCLTRAGLDLLMGWTIEPTRPEYTTLAHRWASMVLDRDPKVEIDLLWKYLNPESNPIAHSVRCAVVLAEIGLGMPWAPRTRRWTTFMALAHDLGHAVVERDDAWNHVEASLGLLSSHGPIPEFVYFGIKHHHEDMDGGGQPYGLSGKQLNWSARLLSLIVQWDEDTPIAGRRADIERNWKHFTHVRGEKYDSSWLENVSQRLGFFDTEC